MFIIGPLLYGTLSCYKQFPSNFTIILSPVYAISRAVLEPETVKDLISLSDNLLDFHEEILLLRPPLALRYLYID